MSLDARMLYLHGVRVTLVATQVGAILGEPQTHDGEVQTTIPTSLFLFLDF
jgi:hypothetical protein